MIRLTTRRPVLFLAMVVVALIVLFPLRLALGLIDMGAQGLSAREVTGPVWAGGLNDAHYGDIALGDLDAGLSPLQLAIGRARIDVAGAGTSGDQALRGALSVSRSTFGVDDVTATLPASSAFAPLPIAALRFDDVSVHFRDGNCASAEGKVTALIASTMPQLTLPPSLSGTARCSGGTLLVPLASQAQTESIAVSIEADGKYRATLTARPADAAAAAALAGAGFQPSGGGYSLRIEGRF
ncbi:MAG: type II secretion system protein N [Sphingomonas sp.]|uniref:type II secretion system protein N n=1 Tax=Sphingomonas sp. TaxID=28214 RepID=UPI001AD48AD7|nr:type II secretion system protein N [Sphingomonas sp.]MBN8807713.1 type II secretion system protein N [Sphingomonas sp.]